MRLRTAVIGIALGFGLLGAGVASAEPLTPDYSQLPNGYGHQDGPSLAPAFSPIQVPPPQVDEHAGTTDVVAHPFLSPWVHDLVPVPPGTAVELQGAMRVQAGAVVVNPNGHCVFAGAGDIAPTGTSLAPLRVDTPVFEVVIEPTLYR